MISAKNNSKQKVARHADFSCPKCQSEFTVRGQVDQAKYENLHHMLFLKCKDCGNEWQIALS